MQLLANLAKLRRAWPSIVGPMMAARTEPVLLEPLPDGGSRLLVGVDHAIMAQQIRFLHQEIRQACYTHCRVKELAQIRTRVIPGAGVAPTKARPKPKGIGFADMRRVASDVKSIRIASCAEQPSGPGSASSLTMRSHTTETESQ